MDERAGGMSRPGVEPIRRPRLLHPPHRNRSEVRYQAEKYLEYGRESNVRFPTTSILIHTLLKGIQLGVGDKIPALVDRDQKVVQKIESGNRDLVTIIECISAEGAALHPSVVFQGQRRDLRWGENNPCDARSVLFSFSSRSSAFLRLTCLLVFRSLQTVGQIKNWVPCGWRRTLHRDLPNFSMTPVITAF